MVISSNKADLDETSVQQDIKVSWVGSELKKKGPKIDSQENSEEIDFEASGKLNRSCKFL